MREEGTRGTRSRSREGLTCVTQQGKVLHLSRYHFLLCELEWEKMTINVKCFFFLYEKKSDNLFSF